MRTNADDVIDRLLLSLGITSDTQLSHVLNKPKTTVSSWRSRDSIPYDICVQIARDKGINLNWLLVGEGEMYAKDTEPQESNNGYMVSLKAQKVAELFDGLNEAQQREILAIVEEKKQFNVMREQLAELFDQKKIA